MRYVLVLDIGKTNIKVHVLDELLRSAFERSMPNTVIDDGPYPHFDVEAIWSWFVSVAAEAARDYPVAAVSVTTHGAAAALIDRHASGHGLALPVLDYEFSGPDSVTEEYEKVRPGFEETRSPSLPGGLNLGRQLFWLQCCCPEEFERATDILLYPQYWVWRLTGERCAEVTSLGCHTDLWSPERGDYSSLVTAMGWRELFPEIRAADSFAGKITPELSRQTGLPPNCPVAVGIHDSNASYLRYINANRGHPFAVVSTGTWAITMASGVPDVSLDESRDMLMNVDYRGDPVACARFMAGREYESVCHRMGSFPGEPFSVRGLEAVIKAEAFVLPQFTEGSGPFADMQGQILADVNRINGAALASMYSALMLDLELDLLQAQGDIFLEGAFLKNPLLCGALATLRDGQGLFLSRDATGTVKGAAVLAGFEDVFSGTLNLCEPLPVEGIRAYRDRWRNCLENLEPGNRRGYNDTAEKSAGGKH